MTDFITPIVLGDEYVDERTGIKGFANVLVFNENGCVEADLEYVETDGGSVKVRRQMFNSLRIKPVQGEWEGVDDEVYTSDVELGRLYRDVQTGLEGWACAIEFFEKIATRVVLRSIGLDKGGHKEIKLHVVDDFLLLDVETEQQAQRRSDAPSPVRPGALA